MSLHTCNSILDRHISEEGKERQKIPTSNVQLPPKQKSNTKQMATWTSIHQMSLNDCINAFPKTGNELDPLLEAKIIQSWRECFNSKSSMPDEILKQKIKAAIAIIRPAVKKEPEAVG